MNKKARERTIWFAPSIFSLRDGYLPISPDPAGVCLMSDVQALSSDSDSKTQPLRVFGNTATQVWFRNWMRKTGSLAVRALSQVISCQSAGAKIRSFFFPTNLFWIIYGH